MLSTDTCPKCGVTWASPNTIPVDLFKTGHYGSMDECTTAADSYGWTAENDKRFSLNCVLYKERDSSKQAMYCRVCEDIPA
jgi:hypothetical protein